MVRLIYLLTLTIFILGSCSIVFKDDILSFKKRENKSNIMQLNGYFIYEYIKDYFDIYFLYDNGIILYGGSTSSNDLNNSIDRFINGKFYEHVKNVKFHWGIYEIETDTIRFERWYPSDKPYITTIREGKILNDSTFIIKRSYKGKQERERNEVYKFRAFSPKPDSTNRFIK